MWVITAIRPQGARILWIGAHDGAARQSPETELVAFPVHHRMSNLFNFLLEYRAVFISRNKEHCGVVDAGATHHNMSLHPGRILHSI